ncbi:CRISPR-associated protein Cas3 [Methanosarcina sp. 2.H.T.1A.6]|uniref:CRISPR-associated helicase/endonuclease Cas3 n=1 Tax=unclassified Methanosarcina TaxID=2644672 RepID=UPI000621A1DE|nr:MULTISPECIES: CRISPR-associated helicase/endonuclease Cas3 [unclassified Methanosarcina]KKG13764.1 CRISPR-associated protein Cas3 [Methanosarcina sp. 2.H.T.1A.3]KKG16349.1 CRISPR-associated protein Cas3 [Methanosarcina sp. 2.H.T.1A.15]KKG21472.1 CRISPR-associated protein Cas3 [Methanosarcina sp. 2.H.T.1A.8]KKG21964.1 CRISPR-associated protein Cas3 [Methanosarcina sp. 2.H.T.1A.6]
MVILAKPDETLLEHTEKALMVFKSVKDAYPETPQVCGVPDFWEHLFYSIFFHDFGKAASGFQKSLSGKEKWKYRHEILSAGFVSGLEYESQFKEAIAMAIITHHKDVSHLRERFQTHPSPVGKKRYSEKLQELTPNFEELREIQRKIPVISKKYLGFELNKFREVESIEEMVDSYKNAVLPYKNQLEDYELTSLHGKYGIFLKGFLTACDHLASGGKYSLLCGIEDMRAVYNFSELRKTQSQASETKGDAFLIAPTGSGKTEASLFWSQANQNSGRSKRVFYLLPYTASINAMYKRLQRDFKDPELTGIQHGKAMYYLYQSFEDEEDYLIASKKAKQIKNLTDKIYRPYKIATPYQILKSMFGIRGFEQNLAEMSNALFIMDEIHAYDAHTTALILETLKILKDYQANFLIMSATLPSFLKEMFKRELGITKEISFTEPELNEFTRHRVSVLKGGILDNLDLIKKEIDDNKKVLVVCNTVAQAQNIYKSLSQKVCNSALIHGRFILRDREEIESKLENLNLLVGTQAIEVSLNIDYDVLFSEPAPLDALIQRFGRVNRKGWEQKVIKPVYIFEQGSEKDKYVYKNQELVAKSLELLGKENILRESRIQKLVDEVYSNGYQGSDLASFEMVKKNFPKFHSKIVPFINERENQEEFYNLYQSVEVVPTQFKLEYLEEIENKRYFEAMKYVVSINVGQYKKLKYNNQIQIDSDMIFASVDYSSKFGLLLDSEESIMGIFYKDS